MVRYYKEQAYQIRKSDLLSMASAFYNRYELFKENLIINRL